MFITIYTHNRSQLISTKNPIIHPVNSDERIKNQKIVQNGLKIHPKLHISSNTESAFLFGLSTTKMMLNAVGENPKIPYKS